MPRRKYRNKCSCSALFSAARCWGGGHRVGRCRRVFGQKSTSVRTQAAPGCRSCRGRPGPIVQRATHVPGPALSGAPDGDVARIRREIPDGQQHGRRVLAVVADQAGAMLPNWNQPASAAGFVSGHDRIGSGPAARNHAVDPARFSELDRLHPVAPEIVQPPQIGSFPDRALDVRRSEGRQAALPAFLAPRTRPGHPSSRAGAPAAGALSGIATDPAPPARGAQAPSRARHAAALFRAGWTAGPVQRPLAAPSAQRA